MSLRPDPNGMGQAIASEWFESLFCESGRSRSPSFRPELQLARQPPNQCLNPIPWPTSVTIAPVVLYPITFMASRVLYGPRLSLRAQPGPEFLLALTPSFFISGPLWYKQFQSECC